MPDGHQAPQTPLAIMCGGGLFPLAVADEVTRAGRPVFLIGIAGSTDPGIARHPHGWIRMGQLGRMLELARKSGARDIVFVGGLTRPAGWRDVRPDRRLLMLLPRLVRAFRGGDDHLLKALADAVTDTGLTVRGVQEVAPCLMLPAGAFGAYAPAAPDLADAEFGFRVLAALSPYDVGQGLVIAEKRVLAIEAAEGTDLMLERIASLRHSGRLRLDGRRGVFVKAPKAGQDLRMDTPAIGLETIARVEAAGLAGIVVGAGEVMALEAEKLVQTADGAGLFIAGLVRP